MVFVIGPYGPSGVGRVNIGITFVDMASHLRIYKDILTIAKTPTAFIGTNSITPRGLLFGIVDLV